MINLSMNNLNIIIIAKNVIFRETLKMYVEDELKHKVLFEFSSVNEIDKEKLTSIDLIPT